MNEGIIRTGFIHQIRAKMYSFGKVINYDDHCLLPQHKRNQQFLNKGDDDNMNYSYQDQDAIAFYGIEGAHPGGFPLTQKIFHQEKIDSCTKILDAGCGTGQTSSYLAKTFFCQVYAIDQHPDMIKKAIKRFQQDHLRVNVYQGSVEKLPFLNDYFDFIVAESSTAFTDIPKSLKEYYRVLKPNGVLINIDMTVEPTLCKEEKRELMNFYSLKRILTEAGWIKVIKMSGFKKVEILESNLVIDEWKKTPHTGMSSTYDPSPILEQIMYTHYKLILRFGDRLGYRVYRTSKDSTPIPS